MAAALLLAALCPAEAQPAQVANLLPNPSFERVEPPVPAAEQVARRTAAPAETWLPRTWDVWAADGATWTCPDDPSQARTGRRCVRLQAPRGAGILRYGPVPVSDQRPWTLRFWARGKGELVAGAHRVLPDRWERLPQESSFVLASEWKAFECKLKPGEGARQWILELATRGPTEAWIDDVLVTYAGLPALGLPPDRPLGRDASTLLYLPFEQPLDQHVFFVKGRVKLSGPGAGRFGRSLALGAEGYVACSANESLDPARGTVELWVKLLSPGNDGVFHNLVGVPGPEGMILCKDQYGHVSFGFSSGWAPLGFVQASGYAGRWQPGVWRHVAACWDKEHLQLFADGKLIAWALRPKLSRALGPELRIGDAGMEIDDLRISSTVRYRLPVPEP